MDNIISVITPTHGDKSLVNLISSLKNQGDVFVNHFILWDNRRIVDGVKPEEIIENEEKITTYFPQNIIINKGYDKSNSSYLRSIGMIASISPWTILADDNIMFENDYFNSILSKPQHKWGFCKRKMWRVLLDGQYECIGVDNFESCKNSETKINHNCLFFDRKLGVSSACLLRELHDSNDGTLLYDFLTKYGGQPNILPSPFVNYVCEPSCVNYFSQNCSPL